MYNQVVLKCCSRDVYNLWHRLCNVMRKIKDMKKLTFILALLLVLILGLASQKVSENQGKETTPFQDTVVEEELVIEDWMTEPFTIIS